MIVGRRSLADTLYLTLPGRAWAWASYDLANTVFSMNVITMYFAQWVVVDLGFPDIAYSVAYSISMAAVGLTMPVFGARADSRKNHIPHLGVYTAACVFLTAAIGAAAILAPSPYSKGIIALALFAAANYFYIGAQTFYNALLLPVSPTGLAGRVSGLGTALGYLGAIIGLLLVWPFVNGHIPFFPASRISAFIPTALFFGILALPVFFGVKENRGGGERTSLRAAAAKTLTTLKHARTRPGVFRFLLGNVFLQDPVATAIVFMAVYAQRVFGMDDDAKIPLFIVSTTFAVAGAAAAGIISDRWGPRRTTLMTTVGWAGTFVLIALAHRPVFFWIGGALVGIGLGFTWTATRPFLAALVKPHEQGEFFGLYNLAGRVAAIIGPLLWGAIILAAAPWPTLKYRLAVGSLAILEVIAFFILRGVPETTRPA